MSPVAVSDDRRRLWRSRWAALGAAVAVTFGGGGLFAVERGVAGVECGHIGAGPHSRHT